MVGSLDLKGFGVDTSAIETLDPFHEGIFLGKRFEKVPLTVIVRSFVFLKFERRWAFGVYVADFGWYSGWSDDPTERGREEETQGQNCRRTRFRSKSHDFGLFLDCSYLFLILCAWIAVFAATETLHDNMYGTCSNIDKAAWQDLERKRIRT